MLSREVLGTGHSVLNMEVYTKSLLSKSKMEDLRKNYQSRIQEDILGESRYSQDPVTKVRRYQRVFQSQGELPVYLLGKYDRSLYRGVMWGSLVGLAVTVGSLFLMASNNMPKKER